MRNHLQLKTGRILFLFLTTITFQVPANANNATHIIECNQFHITEQYIAGGIGENGYYRRGRIESNKHRIPCHNSIVPPSYQTSHYYPHHYPTYGTPRQSQPMIVNQQAPSNSRGCDQLVRMGFGSAIGGAGGWYLGGGKKSRHSIRNTTIGALAGGIIGRIVPC
jgi:hypothetical protein